MITSNEKRVLRYLVVHFDRDQSINEIAKECSLSPNGAYKILLKFEKEGVLQEKKISNIKSFKVRGDTPKAKTILKLAFLDDFTIRLEQRYNDLRPLQEVTLACIAFGSYVTTKASPNDLDLVIVIEQKKFETYTEILKKVQLVTPIKIHDIIQTTGDLIKSLREDNKVIRQAFQYGKVLWGHDTVIEVLSRVCQR